MKGFESIKKKLGFGAMRLPMLGPNKPDMKQIEEMVDYFLEKGYNYFDTAFTYHDGTSESILGKALIARHPRENYCIATKSPMFAPVPQSELYKRVDIQRERFGTDYLDYYLLHNIAGPRVDYFQDSGAWEFLDDIKEKGIAKHIGFSFHDTADVLDKLLTDHPQVDFVQLQINYIDWLSDTVQSKANYEVALKHNVPVIIMEPIKGGALAGLPDSVKEVFAKVNPDMSLAEWALRFAMGLDNAAVVLSGMSTIEQMKENADKFDDPRKLTDDEYKAIDEARRIIESIPTVPCTACNYCTEVCPVGINIPKMIKAYNGYKLYGKIGGQSTYFMNAIRDGVKPSECLHCHACEGNCPQRLEITTYLDEVAEIYKDVN